MKRGLIVLHRWLGVPLSLFFAIWFPSSIGMMYWDFPTVTASDRLAHATSIDTDTIAIDPPALDDPRSDLRLNTFGGRPVYRIRAGATERVVFADTGRVRGPASRDVMLRIAAIWAGRPAADAHVAAVDAVDQWTVQGALRTLRPLWKFSFSDGQHVYVAEATGEVVQHTTRRSRMGAYLGPIPHWLYFTALRQHQAVWSAVVIWSSGLATVAAMLGIAVGIWTAVPLARIPYRHAKRWHAVLGLVFGIGAVTWSFSGMLSMDPFSTSPPPPVPVGLHGPIRVDTFAARSPREAIASLAPARVKELEWVIVLGEPAYLATLDDGRTRVVSMTGPPRSTFDVNALATTLSKRGARVTIRDRYDEYYLDRRHVKPLPVLRAEFRDRIAYIDASTARVVGSYSSSQWTKRWLYHGLHSLDLPWLYERRPLWDIIVIVLMLGGTALSITSLMMAWRVAAKN